IRIRCSASGPSTERSASVIAEADRDSMSPIEAAAGASSPPGAVFLAARCGRGGMTDSGRMRFSHQTLPQTAHFGSGEAQPNIAFALEELGAGRVMLIASARSRDVAHRITAGLPIVAFHDEVVRHVPL